MSLLTFPHDHVYEEVVADLLERSGIPGAHVDLGRRGPTRLLGGVLRNRSCFCRTGAPATRDRGVYVAPPAASIAQLGVRWGPPDPNSWPFTLELVCLERPELLNRRRTQSRVVRGCEGMTLAPLRSRRRSSGRSRD